MMEGAHSCCSTKLKSKMGVGGVQKTVDMFAYPVSTVICMCWDVMQPGGEKFFIYSFHPNLLLLIYYYYYDYYYFCYYYYYYYHYYYCYYYHYYC